MSKSSGARQRRARKTTPPSPASATPRPKTRPSPVAARPAPRPGNPGPNRASGGQSRPRPGFDPSLLPAEGTWVRARTRSGETFHGRVASTGSPIVKLKWGAGFFLFEPRELESVTAVTDPHPERVLRLAAGTADADG